MSTLRNRMIQDMQLAGLVEPRDKAISGLFARILARTVGMTLMRHDDVRRISPGRRSGEKY